MDKIKTSVNSDLWEELSWMYLTKIVAMRYFSVAAWE